MDDRLAAAAPSRLRVAALAFALVLVAGCASGGAPSERTDGGDDRGDLAAAPVDASAPSEPVPASPEGTATDAPDVDVDVDDPGPATPPGPRPGRAACTDDALTAGAAASRPGTVASLVTCNSTGSRAVATVQGGADCAGGCTGYFVAEGTSWTLVGVTGVDDPFAADSYPPWKTLHASWRSKVEAARVPERDRLGAVAGSGAGETSTTTAPGAAPTATSPANG